nr:aldo/keto reductase [Bacillus marinisedimentorum]
MSYEGVADTVELHNGAKMPWLGLGVYKAEEGEEVYNAVTAALKAGYRSIDTASFYGNEEGVGRAIRDSGIPRKEIFVTTKIWNDDQGYESTFRAAEASLERLGLDYVDLLLIHWPVKGKYKDTWRALEALYREGRATSIGVSNFTSDHLEDLMKDAEVKPVVNQVELHPRLTQKELLGYCEKNGIRVEAWSPIMRAKLFDNDVIQDLAQKHSKSPAQIILRWHLQNGVVIIPKSVRENRIRENADIFDFALDDEDMKRIDGLNKDERTGPDPDNFDF